ncbi:MAG: hypothetical protein KDC26_06270 [Armatimonadetes bacterium]|nr:hypothetical protein [Armatimonadota bacterium]
MKVSIPVLFSFDPKRGISVRALANELPVTDTEILVDLSFDTSQLPPVVRKQWEDEMSIHIPLKRGIWIGLKNPTFPKQELTQHYNSIERPDNPTLPSEYAVWFELVPTGDLKIVGNRNGAMKLESDALTVPFLGIEAASINHAYTMLSELLHPNRKSHTANVFDCCYYFDGIKWQKLDKLRNQP